MIELLPYINTCLLICITFIGGWYAYNSHKQLAVQRKEARNQIIFGVLTTAAGLLQAYYNRPQPKNDLLERLLEARKKTNG